MTRPAQSDPPAAAGRRLSPAERAEIEQQMRAAGLLLGRGCSALSAGASSAPLVALGPCCPAFDRRREGTSFLRACLLDMFGLN
jgi:hypothetical protein